MQIQPSPYASARTHHLPHPITVVTERRKPSERDFVKSQQPYGQIPQYNYPSPPMSSPTSPPRTYIATSSSLDSRALQVSDSVHPPGSAFSRGDVTSAIRRDHPPPANLPLSGAGMYQPSPYSPSPHLTASGQNTLSERNYFPQRAAIPLSNQPLGVQISEIGRAAAPLGAGRSSRRGKTHVQKACVNCKKAHLSCDAQRPCARCVASSKQDTCHDVEHKKRGRPRLRDDREARLGRDIAPTEKLAVAAQAPPPSTPYSTALPPSHRRTQSGRVLRSHRPSVGQQSRPIATQRHTIGAGPSSSALAQTPAARVFANLSFRILRANRAFQDQFAHGTEVRGRDFTSFVEPRHEQDLQRLGTDLRNEREQRDPMALPTIFSDQEQQAIDSIDESHIDAYVVGSRERQESWYFNGTQGSMHRPMIVQLGQVGSFPFVLFTMPYGVAMSLPPPLPGYGAPVYNPVGPTHWDQGHQPPPSGYPQPGSGPTTPSLSLQSLAATLPPSSTPVGISMYGISPRYPSGSSDYFPPRSISQRTSLQSPTTPYSQTTYYGASSTTSGTRPQSTASEPPGPTTDPSSSRRPATYHGQARTFGAMREEIEPVPTLPHVQHTEAPQQEADGDDDGRKRRRLNIKELTD